MSERGKTVPQLPATENFRPITEREFARWSAFIRREAGIALGPNKKALLVGRLGKRLRARGVKTFSEYYNLVTERDPEERVRALDSISTNETHFFREPRQFDFLERHVLPEIKASRSSGASHGPIRVWSAGCSTGEEPYSLAMTLLEYFPPSSGTAVEILATDLSMRVLERAAAAIWPIEKSKEISPARLKAFMLKGVGVEQGQMKAGPEIRALVRFARLNLNDEEYAVSGLFDCVFCRNVLIYFDPPTRVRVVEKLLEHLAPHGYLFLGHAETLNGITNLARGVVPTIYTRADPTREPEAPTPPQAAGERR